MKHLIFAFAIISMSLSAYSQSEYSTSEKRLKYGFSFGVNYPILLEDNSLPSNAKSTNGLGGRIGILANYKLFNFLHVSPKAEISFNNTSVIFTSSDNSETEYNVMPFSLDFITHFIFRKGNKEDSPYFYFGPNVKLPLSEGNNSSIKYSTNTDLAIDFGLGFEKTFARFNLLPELRYSFGLLDVNQHPSIKSLKFHNISLIINFLG